MSDLIWKIKQFFRKIIPMALVGLVAYGGYQMYRKGAFRGGFKSSVSQVLTQVPVFGTKLRGYWNSGYGSSVASSYRKKHGKHSRSSKAHHRSRHRRGRR